MSRRVKRWRGVRVPTASPGTTDRDGKTTTYAAMATLNDAAANLKVEDPVDTPRRSADPGNTKVA